jgi:hypothetical protein
MLWLPRIPSSRIKLPRPAANFSPPSSAEVENAWTYTSTPPCIYMAWFLVIYILNIWRSKLWRWQWVALRMRARDRVTTCPPPPPLSPKLVLCKWGAAVPLRRTAVSWVCSPVLAAGWSLCSVPTGRPSACRGPACRVCVWMNCAKREDPRHQDYLHFSWTLHGGGGHLYRLGPTVGFIWGRRQTPISETSFLIKIITMGNVQEACNCSITISSHTFRWKYNYANTYRMKRDCLNRSVQCPTREIQNRTLSNCTGLLGCMDKSSFVSTEGQTITFIQQTIKQPELFERL